MKFILGSWGNWYSGWETMKKVVPEADNLGYWGFVMPDHYMWGSQMGGNSTLDTWIVLTYLAAKTENIRLGTLVTPIPFRPPSVLAKMVSTLDIISNGRTILGVGAGWSQAEFEGYSSWDEPKIRVDKTIEGLELILKLWDSTTNASSPVNFDGKHYSAKGAILEPKPIQKPHPLLLFGGTAPRMFRLAGLYADICLIPPWLPTEKAGEAKQIILEEAKRHDRHSKISFAEILREAMSDSPQSAPPRYDVQSYSKGVERVRNSGSEYVIIPIFGPYEIVSNIVKDFGRQIVPSYSSD
ncbi:MAG: LLM class flavin-dependent oxidoreductase [Thermoproteota archaeon]|nr:LLM class flavin-dependent oxidoreductase [Thermoproteota archaeon]